MTTPTTIEEAIEQNALNPKSVSVGNQTVTQQSIQEQIAADTYLAAKTAAGKPAFGLRMTKLVPPEAG